MWHYSAFNMSGKSQEGDHWQFLKAWLGLDENAGGEGFRQAVAYAKEKILLIENGCFTGVVNLRTMYAKPKVNKPIEIVTNDRAWKREELEYFTASYITPEVLDQAYTTVCSSFTITSYDDDKPKAVTIYEKAKNPIFAWTFPKAKRKKIYRPFTDNPQFKWTSNIKATEDIFCLHMLPAKAEVGFLTAGNRDTLSFISAIGLPAIPLSGENARLDFNTFQLMKSVAPVWYSIMDDDFDKIDKKTNLPRNTGKLAAENLYNQWGIIPANKPIVDSKANDLTKLLTIIKKNEGRGLYELRDYYNSLLIG